MSNKSKTVNNKFNDGISEVGITEEDKLISDELNFAKDIPEDLLSKSMNEVFEEPEKKQKNKHSGHRKRMLQRYEENGFKGFSEHEVLEMLLYHCYPMKDTNVIAHDLIKQFGCLENVIDADYHLLVDCGLTPRAALILTQYKELGNYIRHSGPNTKTKLITSDMAGEFCCNKFGYDSFESFHMISMKSDREVIAINTISTGTATNTEANISLIVKTALRYKASCVILCHNHPSGELNPSNNDLITTNKIIQLLDAIDIFVVDHIICCKNRYSSMSERGTLYN